jgi:hypothetical protein
LGGSEKRAYRNQERTWWSIRGRLYKGASATPLCRRMKDTDF